MSSLFNNGVLVLTYLPRASFLQRLLSEAAKCVNKILYIDLLSAAHAPPPCLPQGFTLKEENQSTRIDVPMATYYGLMEDIYTRAVQLCPGVDVRVLLPPANPVSMAMLRPSVAPVDICIGNTTSIRNLMEFENFANSRYRFQDGRFHVKYIQAVDEFEVQATESADTNTSGPSETKKNYANLKSYPGVVLGGTFDRIHDGHKLLIGISSLLSTKKITCGVSDGPLLKNKTLEEFIEPVDVRIKNVKEFIEDIKPGLEQKVVGLTDTAGPSGTDDDLQLLVLSQETIKGGPYVNEVRKTNNLPELDVHVIDMISDDVSDLAESFHSDNKMSSSAQRIRQLGTLLKEPLKPRRRDYPYVIGLTGGIASGKSSVSKRLQKLGAVLINCDRLGHQAYAPGRSAYNQLLEHFGDGILNADDTINRRALGAIVFSEKGKLNLLNQIVWPEIAKMVREKLEKLAEDGVEVCVVEAAVMLEAGWDEMMNEIWVTVVPPKEAVKRIADRDGYNECQAQIRVESQITNRERVEKANVVISTLWEYEFTQKQAEKAWSALRDRIKLARSKPAVL